MTNRECEPTPLIHSDSDRGGWLTARASGVTATEVARLVSGGIRTKKSIMRDKTGESTFQGNAATERGKRREPYIADWVTRHLGVSPDGWLYQSGRDPRYLATPDCSTFHHLEEGKRVLVEIKSTTADWSHKIPRLYVDQMLWQAYVLDADELILVWEPCDEKGQPLTLEPHVVHIPIDRDRIDVLRAAANRFLQWRDDGCPELDAAVTDEMDEALSRLAAARRDKAPFDAAEAEALAEIRKLIEATPDANTNGVALAGTDASVSYSPPGDKFSPTKWAKRAPRQHAAWEAAKKKYREPGSQTLRVTANKEKAAA